MNNQIYVDPAIDLTSDNIITVIIQFQTQPAHVAVAAAKSSGHSLTIEDARREVEKSHQRFQEEVKRYFIPKRVPFTITHVYTEALNGVAMRIPGNQVPLLLNFKEIQSIHANQEYHLDPPINAY